MGTLSPGPADGPRALLPAAFRVLHHSAAFDAPAVIAHIAGKLRELAEHC